LSEASQIKRAGAKAVKNSGRGIQKGDATLYPFLIDFKEYSDSFSVSRTNWAKISTDAIKRQDGSQPCFGLALGKERQRSVRVYVVGEKMFHEMREAWLEKYGEI
jgi:hypothetical protein